MSKSWMRSSDSCKGCPATSSYSAEGARSEGPANSVIGMRTPPGIARGRRQLRWHKGINRIEIEGDMGRILRRSTNRQKMNHGLPTNRDRAKERGEGKT